MKNENRLQILYLADESFVAEADPDTVRRTRAKRKSRRRLVSLLVAACLTASLIPGMMFFMRDDTPEIEVRRGSAHENELSFVLKANSNYDIYRALKSSSNNGNHIIDGIEDMAPGLDGVINGWETEYGDGLTSDDVPDGNGNAGYQEITDNQERGVIEADRIKRTDKNIFYLDSSGVYTNEDGHGRLCVFDINGEDSVQVGSYALDGYYDRFYLSADGSTVLLVGRTTHSAYDDSKTVLLSLDVRDPGAITPIGRVTVSGTYRSSRIVGGKLLLFTQYNVDTANMNYRDEQTYLPSVETEDGCECIPAYRILLPQDVNSSCYAVVTLLDASTLAVETSMAGLSYFGDAYVTEDEIFLTRPIRKNYYSVDTEIVRISYTENAFSGGTSVTVSGTVKDRWSLGLYDGILRVVTTTYLSEEKDNGPVYYLGTSASLYCVDISTMETVASVENFAPLYESVRSVRFDGVYAYVCTSLVLDDPVFFFDLSDLSNIVRKDTGNISGFSTSLFQLGNGYLLGIGRGNDFVTVKVEVYKETDDGVASVAQYLYDGYYPNDRKALYIDREHGLFGFGLIAWNTERARSAYVTLRFDPETETLEEVLYAELNGYVDYKRGVYIDGDMYLFGHNDFKVCPIGE